ncbi:hypothetical protein VTN77DRAFT_3554 [Rasamsonia byssochlamydoides]|uniref:uncharacterized protein n=1 Tax=Rasamsonia byssochlamydoides TaxID=89139 RepID=UPI003743B425
MIPLICRSLQLTGNCCNADPRGAREAHRRVQRPRSKLFLGFDFPSEPLFILLTYGAFVRSSMMPSNQCYLDPPDPTSPQRMDSFQARHSERSRGGGGGSEVIIRLTALAPSFFFSLGKTATSSCIHMDTADVLMGLTITVIMTMSRFQQVCST